VKVEVPGEDEADHGLVGSVRIEGPAGEELESVDLIPEAGVGHHDAVEIAVHGAKEDKSGRVDDLRKTPHLRRVGWTGEEDLAVCGSFGPKKPGIGGIGSASAGDEGDHRPSRQANDQRESEPRHPASPEVAPRVNQHGRHIRKCGS
jgi:hypothetical protein